MTYHQQTAVTTPDGTEIQCDAPMESLLRELWRLGVTTLYSCQGFDEIPDGYAVAPPAYVACEDSARARWLADVLRAEHAGFKGGYIVDYGPDSEMRAPLIPFGVEYSSHPTHGNRVCFRFPPEEIEAFTKFLRRILAY